MIYTLYVYCIVKCIVAPRRRRSNSLSLRCVQPATRSAMNNIKYEYEYMDDTPLLSCHGLYQVCIVLRSDENSGIHIFQPLANNHQPSCVSLCRNTISNSSPLTTFAFYAEHGSSKLRQTKSKSKQKTARGRPLQWCFVMYTYIQYNCDNCVFLNLSSIWTKYM